MEAIGFGKFQWKLSVLTGLAWVNIWAQHLVYPKDPPLLSWEPEPQEYHSSLHT